MAGLSCATEVSEVLTSESRDYTDLRLIIAILYQCALTFFFFNLCLCPIQREPIQNRAMKKLSQVIRRKDISLSHIGDIYRPSAKSLCVSVRVE